MHFFNEYGSIIFYPGLKPPNYWQKAHIPLLTLVKAGCLKLFAASISQLNFD